MKILYGLLAVLLLAGCSTYIDYGNGRYGVTRSSQEPVAFGVSNSYSFLDNCAGTIDPQKVGMQFTDCQEIPGTLSHGTAPGYGAQLISGLLNLIGMGWIAENLGSVSATATQSQSVVVPAARGHH